MERNYPEIPDYIKKMLESKEDMDEIRIDGEGNWFHNNIPFKNKKIIAYFNKSIDITRDGIYVLHYSDFTYPIVVEDAPIFITGLIFEKADDDEAVFIALTTGEIEKLNLNTLHYKNNILYCRVRNDEFLAKFKRSPSFQLLQNIEENDDIFYLDICGQRIVLTEKV